jgi:hypothetical protein
MAHRIIPRSEWGARYQGGFYDRPVGNLRRYLHHSVTIAPDLLPPFTDDYTAVRELEDIGQARFRGGISYTFAITPAGLIFEGHGIGRIGAHTAGYNTIAAGICLIGNYEKDQPTPAQLAALDWLLHEGVRKGWWTSPTLTGGHRDTKSTACPGANAYALIGAVNRGAYHSITPTPEDDMPTAQEIAEAVWSYKFQPTTHDGAKIAGDTAGQRLLEVRKDTDRTERLATETTLLTRRVEQLTTEVTLTSRALVALAQSRGVDSDAIVAEVRKALEDITIEINTKG